MYDFIPMDRDRFMLLCKEFRATTFQRGGFANEKMYYIYAGGVQLGMAGYGKYFFSEMLYDAWKEPRRVQSYISRVPGSAYIKPWLRGTFNARGLPGWMDPRSR